MVYKNNPWNFFDKNIFSIFLIVITILLVGLILKFFNLYYFEEKEAYATLISGLGAVLAAAIAFYAIEKQIKNESNLRRSESLIAALKEEKEKNERLASVAKAISADIMSATERLESVGLNDYQHIHDLLIKSAEKFRPAMISRIKLDYHVIFHSFAKDITLFPKEIVYDIFKWYAESKGYIETINDINDEIIEVSEAEEKSKFIVGQTRNLIDGRKKIVSGLMAVVQGQEDGIKSINEELESLLGL